MIDPVTDAEREQHVQEAISVLRTSKQFILLATDQEFGFEGEDDKKFEFLVCSEKAFLEYSLDSLAKYYLVSTIAPEYMGGRIQEEPDERA